MHSSERWISVHVLSLGSKLSQRFAVSQNMSKFSCIENLKWNAVRNVNNFKSGKNLNWGICSFILTFCYHFDNLDFGLLSRMNHIAPWEEIYLKEFTFYSCFFIKQSRGSVCFSDKKLEIESFLVTPFLLSISAKNSFEKTGNFETLSLFAPGRRVLFGSQKRPP